MVGKLYLERETVHGLAKSKSPLYTCDFGGSLYSKKLNGTFKVYEDLQTLTKVKMFINY
jgi:hypothetical protein